MVKAEVGGLATIEPLAISKKNRINQVVIMLFLAYFAKKIDIFCCAMSVGAKQSKQTQRGVVDASCDRLKV